MTASFAPHILIHQHRNGPNQLDERFWSLYDYSLPDRSGRTPQLCLRCTPTWSAWSVPSERSLYSAARSARSSCRPAESSGASPHWMCLPVEKYYRAARFSGIYESDHPRSRRPRSEPSESRRRSPLALSQRPIRAVSVPGLLRRQAGATRRRLEALGLRPGGVTPLL